MAQSGEANYTLKLAGKSRAANGAATAAGVPDAGASDDSDNDSLNEAFASVAFDDSDDEKEQPVPEVPKKTEKYAPPQRRPVKELPRQAEPPKPVSLPGETAKENNARDDEEVVRAIASGSGEFKPTVLNPPPPRRVVGLTRRGSDDEDAKVIASSATREREPVAEFVGRPSSHLRLKEMPMRSQQRRRFQPDAPGDKLLLPQFAPSALVLPHLTGEELRQTAPFAMALGVSRRHPWNTIHFATPKREGLASMADMPGLYLGPEVMIKGVSQYVLEIEEQIPVVVAQLSDPTDGLKALIQELIDTAIVPPSRYAELLPPELGEFLKVTMEGRYYLLVQPITNGVDRSPYTISLAPVFTFLIRRVSYLDSLVDDSDSDSDDEPWVITETSLLPKLRRLNWASPELLLHELPPVKLSAEEAFDRAQGEHFLLYGRPANDVDEIRGGHSWDFIFKDAGEDVKVEVSFQVKVLKGRCAVEDCGRKETHPTELHDVWMGKVRERFMQVFGEGAL